MTKLGIAKIKAGRVKKYCVGNQEHFADFSLPRNEGGPILYVLTIKICNHDIA